MSNTTKAFLVIATAAFLAACAGQAEEPMPADEPVVMDEAPMGKM